MPLILLYLSSGSPNCSLFVCASSSIGYSPPDYSIMPTPCPWSVEWRILFYNFSLSQPGLYSLLFSVCPSSLQNNFSLLQTSHIHFSLFYNILIPIPPFLNFIQLSLLSTLLWFFCNFSLGGPVPFQFYFKAHNILFPLHTPLFQSPFSVLLTL